MHHSAAASHTLGELAARFDLELRGNADHVIAGVGTLANASPAQVSFLANSKYRAQLLHTRAGAVVLHAADAMHAQVPCLIAKDPYAAFAHIASLFEVVETPAPGIHPTAVVADTAQVAPTASIGAHVVVGARSTVGAGAVLGPGCVVGEDCIVGPECRLVARVTLVMRVRLGARVRIHPGAVLGAAGFGLAMHQGQWLNVPQLGGVVVGNDCEIGANTCIDRGALEDTVLEDDVRLDNQIQIGHNVVVGAHTAMAGCVAVAGSTHIGKRCLIGGGAGLVGHISLCDGVTITARSLVTHSIHTPGTYSSGTPIMDNTRWKRAAAAFRRLGERKTQGHA